MSEFSDSSVNRTSPIPGGDLQVKYQRVAAEYSKIRAQATVLKKAVVEEQGKNAELQERLREKEQSLRKTDQEIESLTFRNQQLTKRVAFLQDELDSCQNKKVTKKSSVQKPNEQSSSNVLDLEFKKMVEENAQLLSKMYDSEEEHKQEISLLNEQIDKFQKEIDQYSKVNSVAEEKFKATILKLEREKGELYETIKLHEQHLKSLTEELVNLNKFKLETVPHLEAALLIIATYLPFIDTSSPKLECNISKELTAKREVENLTLYFTLFFSSLKKRLHLLHPSVMKDVPASEFNTSLACDVVSDRSTNLANFLSPLFFKFSKHSKSLLPLFLQSLSEEEKAPWCNPELRKINQDLSRAVLQLMQFFMKTSSLLESCVGQTTMQETGGVNAALIRLLFTATRSLEEVRSTFSTKEKVEKDILLDNKMNFELLNVQSDLQTTNINCVHLLASLSASLQSLLSLLLELNSSDIPEDLATQLKNQLNNKEAKLELEANVASLRNVVKTEDDAVWKTQLLKQLEEAQGTIVELEKELIKFRNEFNILKMKGEPVPSPPEQDPKHFSDPNLMGKIDPPICLPAEVVEREEQLKKYFSEQMNSMVVKNQEALAKANNFSLEMHALQRHLEISSEARRESEKKLNECNDKVLELNEKLQLTKQSYETQLSTMSDHLANLNDKLAGQTDQLEQFKIQLNNARRKK
ncbi:unnamed protein product [Bemisia tabaci]|uniref:Protein phosphatase 1 regulatory subunit 21 N-terminal domain-containing protein n=1 Tax=Bemisia tabaci TaxID=7038 RepID=A0A9P0ANT9_BEMTA|nr:unnamed protein product [Bemisia tabaci]